MTKKAADAALPARAAPSHVVLEADWADHLAGKVLPADVDLLSALDGEGVSYRVATPREISLAGY